MPPEPAVVIPSMNGACAWAGSSAAAACACTVIAAVSRFASTAPRMAVASTDPNSCRVSSTPAPTPARDGGMSRVASPNTGTHTQPSPIPAATRPGTKAHCPESGSATRTT